MSQPDRNLSLWQAALLAAGVLVAGDGLLHHGENTYQPFLRKIIEPPIPSASVPVLNQGGEVSVIIPTLTASGEQKMNDDNNDVRIVSNIKDPATMSQEELVIFTQDLFGTSANPDELVIYTYRPNADGGYTFVSLSQNELNFHLEAGQYPPKPPTIILTYYNGGSYTMNIPDDVWIDAVDATASLNGGIYDPNKYDPRLLVALASSENSDFGGDKCSYAGACGRYQFMSFTAQEFGLTDRTNNRASAFAAAKMLNQMGLFGMTDSTQFVNCFIGQTCRTWNAHSGQADYVWRAWQMLKAQSNQRSLDLQPIYQAIGESQDIKYGGTFNLALET